MVKATTYMRVQFCPACAVAPMVRHALLVLAALLAALLPGNAAWGESAGVILAHSEALADWQLAHLDTSHVTTQPDDQMAQSGWVYAVFYAGLTALADASPAPRFGDAIVAAGERQHWGLERRPFHADDYAIGQSWIWAYQHKPDAARIAATRARFDAIIAANPQDSLTYGSNPPPFVESACQRRWCWADSLFMAAPAFAGLTAATGDTRYRDFADREFWATTDFLFDKQECLFFRDSRYFTQRGPHGEKVFWSRGNGWVYAALARLLEILPPDYPSRPRYVALFRQMSARLIDLQKPDGYWPVSLLGPTAGTPPETSGTAFFTYGLAYGVRTGLLTDPRYRQAAMHGWAALELAIQPDGRLGWVQQIGVGPDKVKASDTQIFGVGAFLLAGSEMYRLGLEDARAATVQMHPVGQGYAYNNVNTVSMARDALISSGGYQFAFFYGPASAGQVPLMIARRPLPEKAGKDSHTRKKTSRSHRNTGWQVVASPFSVPDVFSNSGARDDHNLIAAGIDAKGFLHLAWGMHNIPLNYAVSAKPVLGHRFGVKQKLTLLRRTMLGRNEEEVTYPEFFHAPDGALMFAYRDGGAGGGSGNGNEFINRYDAKAGHWLRVANPMVDGIASSMNAYLNSFAYDRKGALFASWTLRETPDWQSNHDLFVARSEDGGKNWIAADGIALGPTITRQSAMAHARILALPQGSSLINQTAMTIAADGTPLIASWWAPDAASDNHRREYMLVWPQDRVWQASPITHRGDYEPQDLSSQHVRELARPVVLTDKTGRILVITRYSAAGKAITDSSNRVRVYWSTDKQHWSHIDLNDGNPGSWEPVYDQALWQSQNTLDVFYQPAGLQPDKGRAESTVAVLRWDEAAFFNSIAVP